MMPASRAIEPRSKNGDIEVLRAVAILFVLICHLNHLFPGADAHSGLLARFQFWGGVDLFFCISGFVIASSILHAPRPDTFAELCLPFWIRRVFRIWPAAILWVAIPLLCAKFFNQTGGFGRFSADLPGSGAAVAQVENFYFMVCKNRLTWSWPCGKADVYWSLSLEEQFYLVFPFLIYLLRTRTLRAVLYLLIAAQVFLARPVDGALWFVRTDAICFGVLIALARHDGWLKAGLPGVLSRRGVSLSAALILIGSIALISVTPSLRINAGLLATASAGLVTVASLNADLIVPVPYLRIIMLWIGSRSFAIYLAHIPCMLATREIFHRALHEPPPLVLPSIAVVLTALGLLVIFAEATYRLIESPFRTLGREIAVRWGHGVIPESASPLPADRIID